MWRSGREKTTRKIEQKDATSPTASMEAVMLTSKIDALEHKYVVVVCILGASLSADIDDEVHVVFKGTLAEMMVAADTERTFVVYETGNSVLYIRLQKALNGYLKIALLFCEKLLGDMQAYGLGVNPYDP